MKHVLASAALVMAAAGAAQAGCVDSEETCKTEMGEYHIALPDGVENPPVLLFLHGAGGNGKGALRMNARQDHTARQVEAQGFSKARIDTLRRQARPWLNELLAAFLRLFDKGLHQIGRDRKSNAVRSA